jgi:hypothetical protein
MGDEITPTPLASRLATPDAPSAVWSLILGILSFVCCGFFTAIPAIICGHRARAAIRKSGGTLGGMGMATAGLALGYIALVLSVLLIAAIVIGGVMNWREEARNKVEYSSGGGREVVSSDGTTRLRVPRDWGKLKELNDAAELQAGNKSKEQYVIVLSENKADFDNITLQKHHQATRDGMVAKMKNPSASGPVEVTIGGRPALQDEISGTQDGTNVVFLHTTVEGRESFHQILAWTLKSRWEQHKEKLHEVTRTFRTEK